MMVNCPKCGFFQHRDQYCAKCGVDMLAFRPAETPFAHRLLKSSGFQLSVFVVLILGVFSFIRYRQQTELAERIREIENARNTQIVEQGMATSEAASQSPSLKSENAGQATTPTSNETPSDATASDSHTGATAAAALNEPTRSNSPPSAAAEEPAAGAAAPPTSSSSATGTSAPAQPQPTPTTFRVYFAELPRAFLAELLNDARNVSSFGTYTFGVIPNFETRVKQNPSAGSWQLDATEALGLKTNQPTPLFRGTRDQSTGQNLGFAMEVTPIHQDENGTHLQVEILRTLRDSSGSSPIEDLAVPLPESFTIPRGSAAFLAGALPRRQLKEDEERLYRSINVLKVMTNESFKSGNTEFVILIEPK